ncbi:semaphorin-3D-like [Lampetra planeri]
MRHTGRGYLPIGTRSFGRAPTTTTIVVVTLLVCLQFPAPGDTWRQTLPRLKLSYRELLLSNSSALFLGSHESSDFQTLLLDEERGRLLVGAKNAVFLLNLDDLNHQPRKMVWNPNRDQMKRCLLAGKSEQTDCANFIRVLHSYNQSHVYVCGTGAFHPTCAFLEMGFRVKEPLFMLNWHSVESGRGKCPYDPAQATTSVMAGTELYAATVSDFMGKDWGLFGNKNHHNEIPLIRTEQSDPHWLNEPNFVGSFVIPESQNPDDDKVYVFFWEYGIEAGASDKAIYSRVARVCKNDMGGQRSLVNKWTTFLKARLVCSIPGPNDIDTHFDELRDVFLLPNKDDRNPIIYAVFTTSSSVFRGSAVCMYSMSDIRAAFHGPFAHKEGPDHQWVDFKNRIPYPRPGTCPSRTYDAAYASTRELPDDVLEFVRKHQLVWEAVAPLGGRPLLVRAGTGDTLTRIAVDRVEATDGQYDVLFLGTDSGLVLKAITINKENRFTEEVVLEEIRVFKEPSPIISMKISIKRHQLYVGSRTGLAQLSLHRCEVYGKACAECCLARDPYCAWDGATCSRYLPLPKSNRRSRRQDVRHGDPNEQCRDLKDRSNVVHTEEKIIFGMEHNSTFLECSPKSHQASVVWFIQHSKDEQQEEIKTDSRIVKLERGLLIRRLHRKDAGLYLCVARENTFAQTVARLSLRVINAERADGALARSDDVDDAGDLPASVTDLRQHYKEFAQLRHGLPPLEEYCERLWQREQRPPGRPHRPTHKWKHTLELRKSRNRRHPDAPLASLQPGLVARPHTQRPAS